MANTHAPRKRALIVNTFFDEYRRETGSPFRVPRAMGPPYLAGAFAPEMWDIRLYNEQYSGPLRDMDLLGWPDVLVLTGLTASFDRMKQLAAYARTLNERVVVVAGGPAVRALPILSARFFDFACTGDMEGTGDAIRDAFGPTYAADEMFPRFDLPYGRGMFGYVETSRYCNFRCSFYSLTGERARYRTYDLDYIRRQLEAVGRKQICLIDNNFYGNDRRHFLAKVDLLGEMYESGRVRGWSCLVSADFFARPQNLDLVRRAGCKAVFSGVESFDAETLRSYNKRQNSAVRQIDMIRATLEAGILFLYGVMLDPATRRLDDLRNEIEFILKTPEISLPAYFTLAIPLLGTPYFRQCVDAGLLLPNTRLRNLDGVTVTMRSLDPIEETVRFARDLTSLRGYRRQLARHVVGFARRYRSRLEPLQFYAALVNAALIGAESFASSPGGFRLGRKRQTYFGPTEALDPCYRPEIRVPSRYRKNFEPLMVTDDRGALHSDVATDLSLSRDLPDTPEAIPEARRPAAT